MGSRKSVGRYGLGLFGIALFISGLFFCPASAMADGMFARGRLEKKIPAIPWQRALLTYKDGVEHLMIQSAVDAEGGKLGWIVPVPSIPTEISKGSVGALEVLSERLRPIIIDSDRKMRNSSLQYGWLAIVTGSWAYYVLTKGVRRRKFIISMAVAGGVAVLPWIFPPERYRGVPAGIPGSGPKRSTVTVEATARVGSYDVATLKAEKPGDLRAWLTENEFSELPSDGDSIVQQYIADGWHFVAAKLNREGTGVAVPHPLAITFSAKRAVYPMKLTSLSGSDMYLELFIVADQQAALEALTRECSDEARFDEHFGYEFGSDFGGNTGLTPGANRILEAWLWKGACITKLGGQVRSEAMRSDYYPTFSPYRRYFQELYTRDAATQYAWIWAFRCWSVGVFCGVLVVCFVTGNNPTNALRHFFVAGAVGGIVAAAGGGVALRVLPVTDVVRSFPHASYDTPRIGSQIMSLAIGHGGFIGVPPEKIATILREYFTYTIVSNPFTWKRVAFDDAPGNVSIEQDGDTVVVQTFGSFGGPVGRLRLPAAIDTIRAKLYLGSDWTGTDSDFPKLENTLREQLGKQQGGVGIPLFVEDNSTYALSLVQRSPDRYFYLIRDDLRAQIEQNRRYDRLMRFEASALGLITHIVPPFDVNDRPAMVKFLDAVSQYHPQEKSGPLTWD